MFGAIPGTASDSSPKRRGPGSSASTSSRLHLSPTRSSAAARGEEGAAMRGSYGIGLDIRLTSSNLRIASHTLPCELNPANELEETNGSDRGSGQGNQRDRGGRGPVDGRHRQPLARRLGRRGGGGQGADQRPQPARRRDPRLLRGWPRGRGQGARR